MMINLERYFIIGIPKSNNNFTEFTISEHGNLFGVNPISHEKQQCDVYLNLINFEVFGFLENVIDDENFKIAVNSNKEININFLKYIGRTGTPKPPTNQYIVFKRKEP